ncbi:MAG: biotin/lipoyl-binding protein, partial [Burkholderiales bacterium]|nr:biotin/lipoyl-binding protein [Burkholderiales bacterium]
MREKQMGRAYAWGLTVLVAAALMACSKSEQPAAAASGASAPNPALTVSTVLPQVSTWPVTVTANGSIAAWQEASIGAEVGGLRLERVKVEVGDTVHKGDVMALLRQDSLKSDVALTKATLAEAQAMLAEAHANAARAR